MTLEINGANVDKPESQPLIRRILASFNFLPKPRDFFGYFKRSAENCASGAETLCRMVADTEEREELFKSVRDKEHACDRIVEEVMDLLHDTFLTPIDREDIHSLVIELDDVMDFIYYAANRLHLYKIKDAPEELEQLADILRRSAGETLKAVTTLPSLKERGPILACCAEINRLENEADEILDRLLVLLFGGRWSPYEVIQLKELSELLERATDQCQDVSDVVYRIVLKHG